MIREWWTWELTALCVTAATGVVLTGLAVWAWTLGNPTPAVGIGIGLAIGTPVGAVMIWRERV